MHLSKQLTTNGRTQLRARSPLAIIWLTGAKKVNENISFDSERISRLIRFFLAKNQGVCDKQLVTSEQKNRKEDESLRERLGLPCLSSEEDAPPVDGKLLDEFLFNPNISRERLKLAIDMTKRFSEWRAECRRLLYNSKAKLDDITPDPPGFS